MSEARFHTIFGLLFVLTFFGSDQLERHLPVWNDPKVGLLSFVVALIWLTLFFMYRGSALQEENRVMRDRIERTENRLSALEDERELR